MTGFRLAVGLLTVVPVRPPERIGRPEARAAMLWAPLAVLPIVLLAAGLGWAGTVLGLPPALAGTVTVAALAFGTRAMHLDGLADTTDGLGSGRDADAALAIMRRGDIGPMGTIALVLALVAQLLAAGALLSRPFGWVQVVVLVAGSRAALALGCLSRVPSARPDGLGRLVAGSVPPWAASAVWAVLSVAASAAGVLTGHPWWQGAAGAAVALLGACWLLARSVRRLGGITGDVLGALVEVVATLLLVSAAA